MKGRTIFDAVGIINDIMDYTEMKGYEGIMSAIDFKRAFDSLSLDLLFKSLELFGTVFNCILKIYAETFQLEWEKVHSLFFKITLDTKLREFQYKILHRICYTNVTLFKFVLSKTPLCYFCNEELETLEHNPLSLRNTFWNELNTILKSQDLVSTNFDIKDILFGHFYWDDDDSIVANYIILESKYLYFLFKIYHPSRLAFYLQNAKNIPNSTFHCEQK